MDEGDSDAEDRERMNHPWKTSSAALSSGHDFDESGVGEEEIGSDQAASPGLAHDRAIWTKAWNKANWGGAWSPDRPAMYVASRDRSRSVPLLPSADAPQAATWYCGKAPVAASSGSAWRSLGSKWRDWDADAQGGSPNSERQLDERRDFVNGCVPHWSKASWVRKKGLLEHELTWAYYRMRRNEHQGHPQRQAVGESLPNECVGEKMRFGRGCTFMFWRDLRPPFAVREVRRVDDGSKDDMTASAVNHPDGELHTITYECNIEYSAERLLGEETESGTFSNKIYGSAIVRIPNAWPQLVNDNRRPIRILGWGSPSLHPPDKATLDKSDGQPEAALVAAVQGELSKTGSLAASGLANRLALANQKATEGAKKKGRSVKITALESLQLGKHASLPRLPGQKTTGAAPARPSSQGAAPAGEGRPPTSPEQPRKRRHRVFTSACGFITYAG